MQGEEPAAGLVHTFGNEVGGKHGAVFDQFLVLEGVVHLGVGHGAGIEPHIDEVRFAAHGLAGFGHKDEIVHVGAVEVNLLVIGLGVVAGHEAFVAQRVGGHEACSNRFIQFIVELLYAADADFLRTVFGAPDGQGSAPETAARQVPVLEVLQPLAEAARTGCCWLPQDGVVEFHHALAGSGGTDEPAVERVVEDRFIRAPAVGVVVHVFLDFEHLACLLEVHADFNVESFGIFVGIRVVGVLYVLACPVLVFFGNHLGHKFGVEVLEAEETAAEVNHGAEVAVAVHQVQRGNTVLLGHTEVIGTESTGDVHDARTVLGGHVVAGNHAESTLAGVHPGDELLVAQTHKVLALDGGDDFVGHQLVAGFVIIKRNFLGFGVEHTVHQCLGHGGGDGFAGVGVVGAHDGVADVGANAQCGVRRESPGGGGPGQHARFAPAFHGGDGVKQCELRGAGGVLHVAVATGLIELVRAQTGACGRRIGLDGVAFVEIILGV